MAETEQKAPQTGASGAAWTDAEKIAYLLILCEHESKVEAKISASPIPAGRSIISCKKLLVRLKEKHKDDIEKIKGGKPVDSGAPATGEKTPRKRKAKVAEGEAEDSPAKKPRGRKKKDVEAPTVEDENMEDVQDQVKEEEV